MNNLTKFENGDMVVNVTNQNGDVMFLIDDVARGCGFTRIENKNSQEYQSILWHRVNKYLKEVGYSQKVSKGDYIPKDVAILLINKSNSVNTDSKKEMLSEILGNNDIPIILPNNKFEHMFNEMLEGLFEGVISFETQYNVDNKYRIDFYNVEHKLAVEYDEEHHNYQIANDVERQRYIENKLGCKFIRVAKGEEFIGINKIIKTLLTK